uniref:Uncharacterized protein n=1 Tax=Anguilla anguilla TaxID=7936 RepID=A0A0E9TA22_ANGAN
MKPESGTLQSLVIRQGKSSRVRFKNKTVQTGNRINRTQQKKVS